jgi:hypothetical protein
MLVRDFFQEIERALCDQPIVVGGERGHFGYERRVVFNRESNAIRIGNAAPIAAAQHRTNRTRSRSFHVAIGWLDADHALRCSTEQFGAIYFVEHSCVFDARVLRTATTHAGARG